MSPSSWHWFEAYGVELEYMIVDRQSLDVRPLADVCLQQLAGSANAVSDAELGPVTFSNELVSHVLELKTTDPASSLAPLPRQFAAGIEQANRVLGAWDACLMPTGMHPWMDPHSESRLWPHDNSVVYETFHRIFDCRGHGWSNLQAVHLNLPFVGDDEFGRLHAAVRLVLPILPALAASSPFFEGRRADWLDTRLEMYRTNSRRIASVAGRVIPEPVFTEADYRARIFEPMWSEIAPHDPEGVLHSEFLNARGAIGRFDRGTIEIRLLDVQECPLADVAICAAVTSVLEALATEQWTTLAEQQSWSIDRLEPIWLDTVRHADASWIGDRDYLRLFGFSGGTSATAGTLWQWLIDQVASRRADAATFAPAWQVLCRQGPLARRLVNTLHASGQAADRSALGRLYHRLCNCLAEGMMFETPAE